MDGWILINQQIGNWPPSEMQNISLSEFDEWYAKALQILEEKNEQSG